MMVSIKGLDKADVLCALYNASKPLGMGVFQFIPGDMTKDQASALLASFGDQKPYFDYLYGRLMKVGISGDEISTGLYDRDLGQGAGERAIAALREKLTK